MFKVNDEVRITATYIKLNHIPPFNRSEILNNPKGIVSKVYKNGCDVRTCSGIWEFENSMLEFKSRDIQASINDIEDIKQK